MLLQLNTSHIHLLFLLSIQKCCREHVSPSQREAGGLRTSCRQRQPRPPGGCRWLTADFEWNLGTALGRARFLITQKESFSSALPNWNMELKRKSHHQAGSSVSLGLDVGRTPSSCLLPGHGLAPPFGRRLRVLGHAETEGRVHPLLGRCLNF